MNAMRFAFIWTLLLLATTRGFASRILAYFPNPAPSHHFFIQPFLHKLGQKGHQVDYYTPIPSRLPHPNVTLIQMDLVMETAMDEVDLFHNWELPVRYQMENLRSISLMLERVICKSEPVQNLLSSAVKYDLLLHEGMFWLESASILKHRFQVPSVAILAVDDFVQVNEYCGLENNPSFMVNAFTATGDRMNFIERLVNTLNTAAHLYDSYLHLEKVQKISDECLTYPNWETRPPLRELISDQALVLINNHPSVGYRYPKPPNFKEVGGTILLERKRLPLDLEKFINEAKDGVIYFSMGSLFDFEKAIPDLRDVFTNVFSRRKERILWKWNSEPWEGVPATVKLAKWFPQQDILAHSKIKLFITHGGLQSLFETIHFGVPVIAIPSFGDQVKNALSALRHGYGVMLALNNITESSLDWALNETIGDPRYKQRVLKGSALLNERLMTPVDEGAYWIEYVIRHGNILQPESVRLSFVQFHCLDVYAFIAIICIAFIYLSYRTISSLYARLCTEKVTRRKKRN